MAYISQIKVGTEVRDISAAKLTTARTINGTSFNGTANITTANWGTARTLTIGNTGKSVNGSANVSWTLAEIGAAASSHNHDSTYVNTSGDTMTGPLTIQRAANCLHLTRTDATPAKGAELPILYGQYQNGAGGYYGTNIISFVGTGNTENLYNACLMIGSHSGSLQLTAGECGTSMASTLSLADTENIYMTCDGQILSYVGCANDASSYKLAQTITSSKITAHVPLYGAVWNDYAEYRNQKETIKPGYCAISNDDGSLELSTEMYQICDGIVSDTFGFAIGETDEAKTPLAVAGRVLAYCSGNPQDFHARDVVCAGPGGLVYKMTEEEQRMYPASIIGTVSEIPQYETWGTGNVKVDGRIWIKVK